MTVHEARLDFEFADDFLDALNPILPRWGQLPGEWVFRGQANVSHDLIPSAHRTSQVGRFKYGMETQWSLPTERDKSQRLQLTWELRALAAFCEELERGRHVVPIDHEVTREILRFGDMPHTGLFEFPNSRIAPLVALAQHHGVPTRLLDWSERPHIAAYFAAESALRSATRDSNQRIVVWCLPRAAANKGIVLVDSGVNLRVQLITAPRASNSNLASQEGIFTTIYDDTPIEAPHAYYAPPLNTLLKDRLRCLTLPVREASEVLRQLAANFVTATQLFPGIEGAVKALEERRYWRIDNPPRIRPRYEWTCSACGNKERFPSPLFGSVPPPAETVRPCAKCSAETRQSIGRP